MKKPTEEQLLDIARAHISNRMNTLEARNHDTLDFYEVGVWNIKAALKAAYEQGAKDTIAAVKEHCCDGQCGAVEEVEKE